MVSTSCRRMTSALVEECDPTTSTAATAASPPSPYCHHCLHGDPATCLFLFTPRSRSGCSRHGSIEARHRGGLIVAAGTDTAIIARMEGDAPPCPWPFPRRLSPSSPPRPPTDLVLRASLRPATGQNAGIAPAGLHLDILPCWVIGGCRRREPRR